MITHPRLKTRRLDAFEGDERSLSPQLRQTGDPNLLLTNKFGQFVLGNPQLGGAVAAEARPVSR